MRAAPMPVRRRQGAKNCVVVGRQQGAIVPGCGRRRVAIVVGARMRLLVARFGWAHVGRRGRRNGGLDGQRQAHAQQALRGAAHARQTEAQSPDSARAGRRVPGAPKRARRRAQAAKSAETAPPEFPSGAASRRVPYSSVTLGTFWPAQNAEDRDALGIGARFQQLRLERARIGWIVSSEVGNQARRGAKVWGADKRVGGRGGWRQKQRQHPQRARRAGRRACRNTGRRGVEGDELAAGRRRRTPRAARAVEGAQARTVARHQKQLRRRIERGFGGEDEAVWPHESRLAAAAHDQFARRACGGFR